MAVAGHAKRQRDRGRGAGPPEARAPVALPLRPEALDMVDVVGTEVQEQRTRRAHAGAHGAQGGEADEHEDGGVEPRGPEATAWVAAGHGLAHQHGRVVVADSALQDLLALDAQRGAVELAVLLRRTDVLAVLDVV